MLDSTQIIFLRMGTDRKVSSVGTNGSNTKETFLSVGNAKETFLPSVMYFHPVPKKMLVINSATLNNSIPN